MKQPAPSTAIPSCGYVAVAAKAGAVILIFALCALLYLTPIKAWLSDGQQIKHDLEFFGLGAPIVFIAGCSALIAIGIPRLPLCSLGGMIFGFSLGLLWTQLGTVLGAYLTFCFVRWHGREYTLQRFPRLRGLTQKLEGKGLMSVLVARQLPINGLTNHLFLGLSPVTHRDYLIGTFIGFLPQGAAACLLGAGLIQADSTRSVGYLALGLAVFTLLGFALKRLVTSRTASKIA